MFALLNLVYCFLNADDSVWLDLYSISKGSGKLGQMIFPFIKPIQTAFFRDVSKNMQQIASQPAATV